MGKIIKFVNRCRSCKYHKKIIICSNKNIRKNQYKKFIENEECPYFDRRSE
ncbi:MAG: hypothetical protein E6583_05235 [Clostridium sp.]|nr:hypothetical protein [Clostridium sp.]